jgi:hypothetical protein
LTWVQLLLQLLLRLLLQPALLLQQEYPLGYVKCISQMWQLITIRVGAPCRHNLTQ